MHCNSLRHYSSSRQRCYGVAAALVDSIIATLVGSTIAVHGIVAALVNNAL